MAGEAIKKLPVAAHAGGRLIDDDDVEPHQFCLVLSKRFPDNAFDFISCCRCSTMLFRDGEAQPCRFGLVVYA